MDLTKYYVFYDGDCGFCNYWVQWILERDREDRFLFSALQSDFGQKFLKERGLETNQFNTLYLWKPHAFYLVKSKAVLQIAKIIGGTYGVLANLNIFPGFISDKIYDVIAENRQKVAPQRCFAPTAEQRKKIIS